VAAAGERRSRWAPALGTLDWLDTLLPTLGACAVSLVLFGVFVALAGHHPLAVYAEMYRGAFGTWFSFQNSLLRAADLMILVL
jgi:simple sugar transport system permease protein